MADTFAAMYRELLEFVPNLPIFLARKLVNERYRKVLELRGWAALRAENTFTVPDAYSTGSLTVTNGSASVVGSGTTFTAGMIGRQLKVNSRGPCLTITAVTDPTHLTVEMSYPLATASAQPYQILQAYITMPTDFKRFMVVFDALRQWRLFFNYTSAELGGIDPARTTVGDPWLLADYRLASGVPRYELWPHPAIVRGYQYLYIKQGVDLVSDSDTPIYPLRGSEIVYGALADACKWPGTQDFPNPLFERANVMLPIFEGQYQEAINTAEREDEGIYLTWYSRPEFSTAPYAPLDSAFIQSHALPALS